ncbi:MAG: GC-type dockerin domain-anchored protein [Phycisphaerales bacterium]
MNPSGQLSVGTTRTGVVVDRVIAQGWDGSIAGTGSGDDPMFADAAGADYALLAGSPAIDAGDNAYVPADVADADEDGDLLEPLPLDLAGASRFQDDPAVADTGAGTSPIVDLGPYERTPDAGCPADLDGNGSLNLDDVNAFASAFIAGDLLADVDGSGTLNLDDINVFAQSFLAGCP